MEEKRNTYQVLAEKGRRHLDRPRHRWENKIKMDLKETGCECQNQTNQAQDRDKQQAAQNMAMNGIHKIWKISCLAEELLAFEEGLCSME